MEHSEKIDQIVNAIINLQANMHSISKDKVGFRGKYAPLSSIWDGIRELLAINELCIVQDVKHDPEGVLISTRIIHKSVQWMEFGPLLIPVQKNAHGIGSGVTYGRRYSLCAALGIVTEDDDGSFAQKTPPMSDADKINLLITEFDGYARLGTEAFQDEWDFPDNKVKVHLVKNHLGRFQKIAHEADAKKSKPILRNIPDSPGDEVKKLGVFEDFNGIRDKGV